MLLLPRNHAVHEININQKLHQAIIFFAKPTRSYLAVDMF